MTGISLLHIYDGMGMSRKKRVASVGAKFVAAAITQYLIVICLV